MSTLTTCGGRIGNNGQCTICGQVSQVTSGNCLQTFPVKESKNSYIYAKNPPITDNAPLSATDTMTVKQVIEAFLVDEKGVRIEKPKAIQRSVTTQIPSINQVKQYRSARRKAIHCAIVHCEQIQKNGLVSVLSSPTPNYNWLLGELRKELDE